MSEKFIQAIQNGYQTKGPCITLGAAMLDKQVFSEAKVTLPLKSINRHGLIAGATGTGKTITLQILAECLSEQGVPCLMMDLKGDLSGLAQASEGHPKIDERHESIGIPFHPKAFPVDMFSISKDKGLRMRATVSEFGPVLFSKMLGLNPAQMGNVAVIFKYCDDRQIPLLDLKDFKKVCQFLTTIGKEEIAADYGQLSIASVNAILRKVLEVEQQGGDVFFGEPSFDVRDLCRKDSNGRGIISILRVTDIQSKPKLFSSFMLSLLAEVYATFPEIGDPDKPKLVLFIDEAHLIFKNASEALLEQIESIIKLIRSKGVGIYFCTQVPADVPNVILSQLGLKVQHALRAFTAKDRKAIKLAAENYPISEFYKTSNAITECGIGEALVTGLDEKGRPMPLVWTMLQAPRSRMGPLTPKELDELVCQSELRTKYETRFERESAYEILNEKLNKAAIGEVVTTSAGSETRPSVRKQRAEASTLTKITKNTLVRQLGRTVVREVTRGLLSVLGVKPRRRS